MIELAPRMARLGTETAFEVLARAQALAAEGREIINLGIGQPDFPTPPHIVEAGIQALQGGDHGYTAANGLVALREAVAADLQARHGVAVDPAAVVVLPGAKPVLFFAALMLGAPGVEMLVPDPGFPIYASAVAFSGAMPVPVPLREETGFAMTAEAVLSRITPRTRMIILNTPANPTGGTTPRAELDRLVAGLAERSDIVVLADEIYSRLLYDGAEHVSLLRYPALRDRLILLDGWSKTYAMTGWRLGYGVFPPALVEPATRLAINDHSCVNAAAQHAAIAALTGPQDAVEAMRATFDTRRQVIVEGLNALPGVRCLAPSGAFYAFANIEGTGMDARTAQDRFLEEAGVATVAGTSFGAAGEGFVRLSYAASTEAIETALARLQGLLGA